jgi:hypothetical protein
MNFGKPTAQKDVDTEFRILRLLVMGGTWGLRLTFTDTLVLQDAIGS